MKGEGGVVSLAGEGRRGGGGLGGGGGAAPAGQQRRQSRPARQEVDREVEAAVDQEEEVGGFNKTRHRLPPSQTPPHTVSLQHQQAK